MLFSTAAGVELPHKQAHRPRTMEAGQVRDYLRALWGHECEAVAICSVTLGLRRGEACGLKWSDIDLRTGEVRIRRYRQVVHGREVVEAPKTERSARSCWLPRFAVRLLRTLRKGRSGWLCELSPDAIARRIRSAYLVYVHMPLLPLSTIWDTECYAAIQTQWPMLRPPVNATATIKLTMPPDVTSTSAVLLETMPVE